VLTRIGAPIMCRPVLCSAWILPARNLTPALQQSCKTVISVGALPRLLSLRQAILESAGYRVYTTTDASEAKEKMADGNCGVMVMCYSVPHECRQELIQQFRAHCPEGRIVAITNRPVTQPASEVDDMVYGVEGPEVLLGAVQGKAA